MIPVPSYQVQEFFDWLSFHKVKINHHSSQHEQLLYWAKQFLREKREGCFKKEDKLSFILNIFQNCPMIRETSIIEQMKHFCSCGRCLDYLYRSRRLNNVENYVIDSLHPFLQNFLTYLNKRGFSRKIQSYNNDRLNFENKESYFRHFIRRFGDELFTEFEQYLESVNSSLINDFIQNHRNGYSFRDENRSNRNNEERTKSLGINEDLEKAAARLVASIEQDESRCYDLAQIVNSIKNFPQLLEFIEWLKKKHPDYMINQATSRKEIKEIIIQFCQDLDYDNSYQFSTEVVYSLLPTFIHKFINMLQVEIIPEKRKSFINIPFVKFIERYENIHFHGIFIFGENNNISEFVKNYGRDLHDLTDDYIDIYYTQNDLKNHVTGYQRRKQFRNLDIQISHIPAFTIWKNSLTNSQIISFEGLSHEQMFNVVKHIASGIAQKKSLDEVAEIAKDQVKLYLNHSSVINNYHVGQAGAVGQNALAPYNIFNQNVENEED